MSDQCTHDLLRFETSSHASSAGYRTKTLKQRYDATREKPSKAREVPLTPTPSTFPAPLILPGDELSWDPLYEPQPFREWVDASYRNKVTPKRRTIYLASYPSISPALKDVAGWAMPALKSGTKVSPEIARPSINDVQSYLRAFYHQLPVKILSEPPLEYTPWQDSPVLSTTRAVTKSRKADQSKKALKGPQSIALSTGTEAIRIRTRSTKDKIFPAQLNLNDLLDVAMAILPEDAYAILMLVDHDLYEDDEDDFCCGRAYGGSRVAVVSTARYHPALDEVQEVERDHAWPGSHCAAYMQECCASESSAMASNDKKRKVIKVPDSGIKQGKGVVRRDASTALGSAVRAFKVPHSTSETSLSELYLSRVCKTASHELGHCFGFDHCVYYACIMQGTAGLSEDARQPPYLCPVCLAKVLHATGATEKDLQERLLNFCDEYREENARQQIDGEVEGAIEGGMFAAFAVWLKTRIDEIEESTETG